MRQVYAGTGIFVFLRKTLVLYCVFLKYMISPFKTVFKQFFARNPSRARFCGRLIIFKFMIMQSHKIPVFLLPPAGALCVSWAASPSLFAQRWVGQTMFPHLQYNAFPSFGQEEATIFGEIIHKNVFSVDRLLTGLLLCGIL